MFEARRDDNITRLDRGAIARRDDEASIQNIEPLNVPRHRRDLLLFLKPLCIRKIKLESEWFDVLDSLSSFPKKLFHSVDISRVEMPITGGAQVHPGRHALLPELHRLPAIMCSMPSCKACAATANPNGPAPIISRSISCSDILLVMPIL